MRLLVTTQAVDREDQALGFFNEWLVALALQVESIEVICLKEGSHALPANVHVHTLGKERGVRSRVVYGLRFYILLLRLRGRYDAVFVHMNPEYVVMAGLYWRLMAKRVVLWYTHRQVNLKLRLAVMFASAVVTAAPESLRLKSPKVSVIGHGVDTAMFHTPRDGTLHEPLALVSVGRITPIKRLEILIDALALLAQGGVRAALTLVGEPVMPGDHAYTARLHEQIATHSLTDAVRFVGARPYRAMPEMYEASDLSVNLAPTGGIDKAVLESMAAGAIPLVANRAFATLFGGDADALLFEPTAEALVEKIRAIAALSVHERHALIGRLTESARREADLSVVIERLLSIIHG